MLTGGTLMAFGLMFVAEKVLAPEYKPTTMIGRFAGDTEKSEIVAKQPAVVEFTARTTAAQVNAAAAAQMEAEISRVQQQAMAEALAAQTFAANASDLGCMLSGLIPNTATRDWRQIGDALHSGCGVSDRIRKNMMEQLAKAGRNGSALIQRPAP
jgi:hypothetical protein